MEDSAKWNPVQRAIDEALEEHRKMLARQVCGPSAAVTVYDALVAKGFIKEEHCQPKK